MHAYASFGGFGMLVMIIVGEAALSQLVASLRGAARLFSHGYSPILDACVAELSNWGSRPDLDVQLEGQLECNQPEKDVERTPGNVVVVPQV